jgi:putative ABC transport system permease protein
VILGNGVWRTRYGRDDAIVGRSVIVNGAAVRVIGVMPDRFGFPNNAEVWLPLANSPVSARGTGDARTISAIGRLAPAATIAQARAEVDAIGQRLANGRGTANAGVRMELVPINERFLAQLTHPAWLAS